MKKLIIVIAVFVLSCSHEKNTQVSSQTWELVDKKDAQRYYPQIANYVWLIWRNVNNGVEYWEYVEQEKAHSFIVGMRITNRDRR